MQINRQQLLKPFRKVSKSSWQLSRSLGISRSSVLRILLGRGIQPYISRLIHALHSRDNDRIIQFEEKFLDTIRMIGEDETILDRVWWSDEAIFKLNGTINRHNCVYGNLENPRMLLSKRNGI